MLQPTIYIPSRVTKLLATLTYQPGRFHLPLGFTAPGSGSG